MSSLSAWAERSASALEDDSERVRAPSRPRPRLQTAYGTLEAVWTYLYLKATLL